jgi:tetratricopeptide (TPR) repeat protein
MQADGNFLTEPHPAVSLLSRERLHSRIADALTKRFVLLCAPGGFGKSVAVRRALRARHESYLAYTLRPADTSVAAFARGLAETLDAAASGLRPSYATAAEYAQQSAAPHQEFALWFQRHLEGVSATVLLEDVHHAGLDSGSRALFETLVETCTQIRWILTSRTDCDLPLERWRAAGIAAEPIGAEDLRLTKLEAHELARVCNFPSRFVETLYDETQGWPLAFHIGTKLPDEMEQLRRLRPRTPEDAYSFLVRRLFARYDSDLRDVLLQTSVFAEFDRDLLRAGPWGDAWEQLVSDSHEGLLLAPIREGVLRFHDLFQSFLHEQLCETGAWQRALRVGAAALENSGRIPDALRLFIQAEAHDDVRRLCESHGFELMEQGRRDEIRAALAAIDTENHDQSPVVLALYGMNESLLGRSDTAESWFLHSIEKAASSHVRAEVAYRYALDLIRHGRVDAAAMLEPYVEMDALPPTLRASIQSTLATAYVLAGRFDEGGKMIDLALSLIDDAALPSFSAKVHHHAGWVALFTGRVDAAKHHTALAVRHAIEAGMYDLAARAYSVSYNILYDVEDDPAATLRILDAVLDCGLKAGSPQVRLFALLGKLDIAAESGDHDEVQRIVQILSAHEVDFSDSMASEALLPAEALRVAGKGEFAEAHRLLVASGTRQITPDRRALRFSEIALYAAGAKLWRESRAALEEVLQVVDSLDAGARRTVRTRLNCALALYLLGETAQAESTMNGISRTQGRLDAFHSAVEAIVLRWNGARNHNAVAEALEKLREAYFGGIANLLAALPFAPNRAR